MDKRKAKLCPYDTRAYEVRPGVYEWTVSGLKFIWEDRKAINLAMDAAGDYRWLAHADSLRDAVVYSWGVWAGLRDSRLAGERT